MINNFIFKMDLNFILNYWNNVDRHFFKKKIISIVLYCNYGFLVQHTHTPSPSVVIHFKKHEGVVKHGRLE